MWTSKGSTFLYICICVCTTSVFSHKKNKFPILYQWGILEYVYESPQQKEDLIKSGELVLNLPVPLDVDVYYNSQNGKRTVFITTPRLTGIPVSLSTVVLEKDNKPYLKPYPSWDWYKDARKCGPNRILSVYRVEVDECDRLWVLDNGKLEAGVICPPQVLAFDLKTNRLIKKFDIPKDQYQPENSNFVTPIVEVLSKENNCKKTFLYLADSLGNAIVVYDFETQKSWKVQHYSMYPDPDFGEYNIKGVRFEDMDGVLGMAISPKLPGKERKLFYHAMSSDTENWIYTKNLRNKTASSNLNIFHTYKGRRGTQSVGEAIDKEGILYFSLVSEMNIACFKTDEEYGRNCSSTDIIASNQETLEFTTGVKVRKSPNGKEELWVVTFPYSKVEKNNIKATEINFRVLVGDVEDLKKGTRCQRQPGSGTTAITYGGLPYTFPPNKIKK